jgi:hypothetical protein
MDSAAAALAVKPSELAQHRSHLLKFAMLRLRHKDAAEGLVQEVFVGRECSLEERAGDDGADGLEALFRANRDYAVMPREWRNPEDALADRRFFEVDRGAVLANEPHGGRLLGDPAPRPDAAARLPRNPLVCGALLACS